MIYISKISLISLCFVQPGDTTEENPVSQEGVPPGYEAVSLIEALNGPCNQFFPAPGDGNIFLLFSCQWYILFNSII